MGDKFRDDRAARAPIRLVLVIIVPVCRWPWWPWNNAHLSLSSEESTIRSSTRSYLFPWRAPRTLYKKADVPHDSFTSSSSSDLLSYFSTQFLNANVLFPSDTCSLSGLCSHRGSKYTLFRPRRCASLPNRIAPTGASIESTETAKATDQAMVLASAQIPSPGSSVPSDSLDSTGMHSPRPFSGDTIASHLGSDWLGVNDDHHSLNVNAAVMTEECSQFAVIDAPDERQFLVLPRHGLAAEPILKTHRFEVYY